MRAIITSDNVVIPFEGVTPQTTAPVWKVVEIIYPEYDKELFDCNIKSTADFKSESVEFELIPKSVETQTQVIKSRLVAAVQEHLDTKANEFGYDNIFTACTYANSTNLTFKNESLSFIGWRDNVWTHCHQVLSDVQNQLRTIPTVSELIAELPVFGE